MGDLATQYRVLRDGVLATWIGRDVIRVSGPDAIAFLQGQCSQDLAALELGQSAWSLILEPQGKVDALVRASRTDDDVIVLDLDGGYAPAVIGRLQRFKLRIKADIEPLTWRCLALRGPSAPGAGAALSAGPELLVLDAAWPGLPGVDLIGVDPPVPPGIEVGSTDAFEVARIEAGTPAMGAELTERTIPAETGLVERTVSFTKGCYTGQELVARIDSRGGHVPRHLRGLTLSGPAPVGAAVTIEGREVGAVTSVARTPGGGAVALAYIHRDVSPPVEATVAGQDGAETATIQTLPLVA
jgi:folate-binding protein YgfZ